MLTVMTKAYGFFADSLVETIVAFIDQITCAC